MTTNEELDELAAGYYLDPPADVWLEERVQAWILQWLVTQIRGRTLEMGWGTGVVSKQLLRSGIDLEVVEGSARLVREGRKAGATVTQALFEDFDPGPIFDTVLALHVLEHVENPVRMAERIRRWLRPGGRLIVVVPNAYSIHRRLGRAMTGDPVDTPSERDLLVGHRRVYSIRQLCADLGATGFDTAGGVFGWFLKPVPNSLMLDWAPEIVDALCQMGWEGSPADCANVGVVARR